ncbi:hypothetical protein [Streptomyces sp. ST2-7A]|uniref:hypothetical protein n=1 Tax=Streptomyces sp. ST2-7A TaxID=2907214 RepID=UPI001F36C8D3|nr:hypothetical protein [Streptomyces sp. ST2-7A]MCE7080510.1 hypothetical protein [Streptomyces sp. ST2-7A]
MSTRPATVPNREEPSGRRRDDACPGALRLHAADDGALARVRLPGGLLDTSAARVLADLAEEFGDGRIDLTSRGNMQLRALPVDCGAVLASRLRAAGLLPSDAHERARNIVATPLAGARSGVHAVARELDRALCADPTAARLSGRFLFAVDDGRGDVATLEADVTLVASATPAGATPGGPGATPGGPGADPAGAGSAGAEPVEAGSTGAGTAGAGTAEAGTAAGAGSAGAEPVEAGSAGAGLVGPAASPADRWRLALGTDARVTVRRQDAARAAVTAARLFLTTGDRIAEGAAPVSSDAGPTGRPERIWRVADLPTGARPDTGRLVDALAAAGISAAPLPGVPEHPPGALSHTPPGSAPAAGPDSPPEALPTGLPTSPSDAGPAPPSHTPPGSAPAAGPDPLPEALPTGLPGPPSGAVPAPLPGAGGPAAEGPTPPAGGPRPVPGPARDGDGAPAVCVLAPLGTLAAGQLRALADLAGREGTGELRVTPWRGVVLPLDPAVGGGAPADARAEAGSAVAARVARDPATAGLITRPDEPWHGVGACTGRPGCGRALADVRADAAHAHTRPRGPAALPVYWSGCPRRCGRPRGGPWLDVLAEPDGYRVTLHDDAPDRERPVGFPGAAPPTAGPLPVDGVATALAALARGASP